MVEALSLNFIGVFSIASTLQSLYNTVHYNKILDMMWISVEPQIIIKTDFPIKLIILLLL